MSKLASITPSFFCFKLNPHYYNYLIIMQRYLTNPRSSRSTLPPATPPTIQHAPSSQRLGKIRAINYSSPQASQASSSTSTSRFWVSQSSYQTGSQASSAICLDSPELSPPLETPSPVPEARLTHDYPSIDDKYVVRGISFNVDFERVYRKGKRLKPSRLGYAVRYKAYVNGRRELSNIWRHGLQLQYYEVDNTITKLWLCKLCHQSRQTSQAWAVNGTAHIIDHVRKVHSIDPSTSFPIPSTPVQLPESPFTIAAHIPGSSTHTSHLPWEEDHFQTCVVDWTIMRDFSFTDVTSLATRGLLTWNRTELLHVLPDLATTLSTYTKNLFDSRKPEVIQLIQSAIGKIAVSVNVWTSANHLSFLGVVAHFVDADYNQRDLLIGFRNLLGDHTAERQALVIIDVIREYDFESNFNCFVGDNASNNDKKLISHLNKQSAILNVGTEHRIRCAGHIINLIVKATLFGEGVSQFEEDLAKAAPLEQFKLYRQHGVVGKLHNFVRAVCASHKRREMFLSTFNDLGDEDPTWRFVRLQLLQDGGVRWHSVYLMLLRCQELREPIKAFQRKNLQQLKRDKEFGCDDESVG